MDNLVASAGTLLTSPRVIIPAGRSVEPKINSQALLRKLKVANPSQSLVFWIALTGEQDQATDLVEAVVAEFEAAVAEGALPEYEGLKLTVGEVSYSVEVDPESEVSKMSLLLVVAGIGVLVTLTYVLVRVFLDDTIRTPEDLAELTDDAVLAPLGDSPVSQQIASGLPYLVPEGTGRVVAFSGIAHSAVSVADDVARALGASGRRVAVVDLDLRNRPMGSGGTGVAEVVAGDVPLEDAVGHEGPITQLLAGGRVPNPGDFLTRTAFAAVLEKLRHTHDWVLLNTTPLCEASDGVLASRLAATTLLVLATGEKRSQVREALNLVEASNLDIAALVVQ
ncbi:hypothetical protein [Arachnia propionica]|uniref:Uncharacterized protein n=1 Tax=Arachnia propionica TaxID=1750 RepID=A0A3P1WRZ7_9ACTN|nr:hypothetical protein [Arachnia propionica]RRD49031.1 hypothetical protein EII35_10040 [Arachnia propionica]